MIEIDPSGTDSEDNTELNVSLRQPVEKFYFLSVQRVSYGREAVLTAPFVSPGTSSSVPTHRLVVQDLRAAWTKSNRQVAFALYDSWIKAQVLKRNLSPEVMKLVRMPESNVSPIKPRNASRTGPFPILLSHEIFILTFEVINNSIINICFFFFFVFAGSGENGQGNASKPSASAPVVDSMLQQLLADVNHRNVVFSEDLSTASSRPTGAGTTEQEGAHLNWLIELVNSQVT